MVISKELFVEAINEIKRACDYQDGLNEFLKANCADGYVIQPDCSDMLIKVIETVMGLQLNDDGYSDVSYFCYELEFGRKFKPGDVKERDCHGNEVDLDFSSAESLYDYLASKENDDAQSDSDGQNE